MHNNIMVAGSRDRPPTLATERYLQWRSWFLRYIDTRPNGDALRKCILSGPYKPTTVLVQAVAATDDSPAIPEHTTVMWEAIERLQQEDTDEEIDEQELEAHYNYMAKIQKVPTADSGTDYEPLEQVQNDAGYNVFANNLQHSEQSESISNTCLVEMDDSNVIPDSPDMCNDDIRNDQNDVESDDERVALANLISNLKLDTEFEKYKAFNDRTVDYDKLERKLNETLGQLAQKDIEIKEDQFRAPTAQDMKILIQTCLMPLAIKTQNDSFIFVHELKQEMHVDLKYVESLEKEIDELESDKAEFSNMYDIILQEGLNYNLFSIVQFCNVDLKDAFQKSTCFVRDLQGNDLIIGNRGSDFYKISLQESISSTPLCLMAKASPTQAWLWHRILSHLNFDYINLLSKKDVMIGLPKLKYVNDQLCSSCELSKAKRSSFKSKVVPSSKGKLNLLHMDLCGPMRVANINGKKYILVIVDDYSRYTWTLFLRSKDETPKVLKEFLTMIQRNLQALVITIRTDKGTKFLNKTFNAFFKEEGVEHQTSTARTLEQNGVVE
nr:retrovirus-related Pol polyprotein from transposon TNT 1-94 [Tanacetum cinerariifolium]